MKGNNMKLKNYLILFFIAIFFVGCGKKEDEVIKIGAILPLTGDLANYGNNAKNGINLLADVINENGGINGKLVEIIYEDSKALPKDALSAAQKLIKSDKVIAIIGGVASSALLSFSKLANDNKTVVVSPAASSPKITEAGPYIYRVWPSDIFEADAMLEYLIKNSAKSLALLYVNNDYGISMISKIENELSGAGIDIVIKEAFVQNTNDVRTQLSKIKETNAEYLYIISYPAETIVILKQIKELGITSKKIATSSFEDPIILDNVGEIANGVIFTSPLPADSSNQTMNNFLESYKVKYNEQPGLVADYGYDALQVIIESLRISGDYSKEGVKKGIDKLQFIEGATGKIMFDSNGDVIKPAGIKTVENGIFVWLKN